MNNDEQFKIILIHTVFLCRLFVKCLYSNFPVKHFLYSDFLIFKNICMIELHDTKNFYDD